MSADKIKLIDAIPVDSCDDVSECDSGTMSENASPTIKNVSGKVLKNVVNTPENVSTAIGNKIPENGADNMPESSTKLRDSTTQVDTEEELKAASETAKDKDMEVDASEETKLDSNLLMPHAESDGISTVSLVGSGYSDESHDPPVSCFNWIKFRVNSPQKMMKSLRKLRSPKAKKMQSTEPGKSVGSTEPPAYAIDLQDTVEQTLISPLPERKLTVERIDYANLAEERIIPAFLGSHPCYNVMPTSGKVIVLSVELLVKNAFGALVSNDIKAAPLWDATLFDFVGMLTISDFINVLRHYYYSSPVSIGEDIKDIENQSILTWRRITKVERPFVKINGSDSLAQATKLLIQEGIHRLPVFDEKRKCVLFVLTRKRILNFLSHSLFENFEKTNVRTPSFFKKTIRELQIGTFENIAKVKINTKVVEALDLFVKRRVSALPVVDENGVLIDIFEKFDVFALAKEQTYNNLDMPINDAICQAANREMAWICTLDETLGTVINKLVNNKVHRMVVIDEKRHVAGIISLSDILKFLVVQPLLSMEDSAFVASQTIEEASEGAGGCANSELESSAESSQQEAVSKLAENVADLKIEESDDKSPSSDGVSSDPQPE